MPIYEFKCVKCKILIEKIQKHDDPNPLCQECNERLERVLSQNSFRLKGKGWYKDGYSKGE